MSEQTPNPDSDPDPDEVADDHARDAVTVGELAEEAGPGAFVPIPLEEVE